MYVFSSLPNRIATQRISRNGLAGWLLLLGCLLLVPAVQATNVRFDGVTAPSSPPFDITTQSYTFQFVETPSSDQPVILSQNGSDAYTLCGHCYATSTFNFFRDSGVQFDLASMVLGATGNSSDEFDFTITGNLSGGGTVTHLVTVPVTTGQVTVNFNSSWRDLASVNVSIDNVGNLLSASSVDNIHVHQTPVITYGNVPVTDGSGTNNDPKPIAVQGMILNGVSYDLTVNWGTSYNSVYSGGTPLFEYGGFITSNLSRDAVDEIGYALARDSYVSLPPLTNADNGAFVLVPGATAWGGHWGATVELDTLGLILNDSFFFASAPVIDYIGWVKFGPPPQSVQSLSESSNFSGYIHPHHDGSDSAIAGLNDPISVVVFGSSVENGDAEDFFTGEINPDTVRYGPGQGAIDPDSIPEFDIDVDRDGDLDARFQFLTGDAGLICADTEATIMGERDPGEDFAGVSRLTTDCDAGCHN